MCPDVGIVVRRDRKLFVLEGLCAESHHGNDVWRWTVCVLLHVGCTTLSGIGLTRVWRVTHIAADAAERCLGITLPDYGRRLSRRVQHSHGGDRAFQPCQPDGNASRPGNANPLVEHFKLSVHRIRSRKLRVGRIPPADGCGRSDSGRKSARQIGATLDSMKPRQKRRYSANLSFTSVDPRIMLESGLVDRPAEGRLKQEPALDLAITRLPVLGE